MWFTYNVPPLSCYWKFKLPPLPLIEILVAHTHDVQNCQKSTASVVAFTANMSMATSFQRFSHKGVWESATMNHVVFISGSEFRSEPKSQFVNAKWASDTFASWNHHKNPLNTPQVNKRNNTSGVGRPIGNWDKKMAKLQKSYPQWSWKQESQTDDNGNNTDSGDKSRKSTKHSKQTKHNNNNKKRKVIGPVVKKKKESS